MLKQVPDTETVIKIGPNGESIATSDIKWVINPYDEYAVEAALRLKDSQGANVTTLSLGPQRAVESIRSALAMGADKGLLVDDPATEGSDASGSTRFGMSGICGCIWIIFPSTRWSTARNWWAVPTLHGPQVRPGRLLQDTAMIHRPPALLPGRRGLRN